MFALGLLTQDASVSLEKRLKEIIAMVRCLPMITVLLSLAITCTAHADDIPRLENYSTPEDFMSSEGCQRNQLMYNYCASEIKQFHVLKLESLYQKFEQNGELEAAKTAWNDFVEKECKRFAKPYEMGSIYPLEIDSCKQALTKQRIGTLTKELSCNRDGGCSYPE